MKKIIPINENLNIILSEEHPQYPIFGYLQPDEQKQLSSIQCVNMNRYRFILLLNRTLDFLKQHHHYTKAVVF